MFVLEVREPPGIFHPAARRGLLHSDAVIDLLKVGLDFLGCSRELLLDLIDLQQSTAVVLSDIRLGVLDVVRNTNRDRCSLFGV